MIGKTALAALIIILSPPTAAVAQSLETAAPTTTAFEQRADLVGGQALTAEIRHQMSYGAHATSLEDLETLVGRLPQAELTDAT